MVSWGWESENPGPSEFLDWHEWQGTRDMSAFLTIPTAINFLNKHNLKIKIVRIFNTYGPNMTVNDGRVVSNFINQALNQKEITINGNGNQTRSFQYIDDLLNGMIKMMETEKSFIGPVNLGNPNEISMNELASKVLKLTQSKSRLVFMDLPEDDPKRRKPDISLAIKTLNWKPEYDLDEGLIDTIKYFKEINLIN